jgi:hypothetical protein
LPRGAFIISMYFIVCSPWILEGPRAQAPGLRAGPGIRPEALPIPEA